MCANFCSSGWWWIEELTHRTDFMNDTRRVFTSRFHTRLSFGSLSDRQIRISIWKTCLAESAPRERWSDRDGIQGKQLWENVWRWRVCVKNVCLCVHVQVPCVSVCLCTNVHVCVCVYGDIAPAESPTCFGFQGKWKESLWHIFRFWTLSLNRSKTSNHFYMQCRPAFKYMSIWVSGI